MTAHDDFHEVMDDRVTPELEDGVLVERPEVIWT